MVLEYKKTNGMKKSSLYFGIPKAKIYFWKDKEKNKLSEITFEKSY